MGWEVIRAKVGRNAVVRYQMRISRNQNKSIAFQVSRNFMKQMRWQVHDRVVFLVDRDSGLLGVRRTSDRNGYMITHNGKKDKACSTGRVRLRSGCEPLLDQLDLEEPWVLNEGDFLVEDDGTVVIDISKR